MTQGQCQPRSLRCAQVDIGRRAQGDYIYFLDADDRWTPNKFGGTAHFLEQRPDIGLVFLMKTSFLQKEIFVGPAINKLTWGVTRHDCRL